MVETHIIKANAVATTNMNGANCLGTLMKKNPRCKTKIISSVPCRENKVKIFISRLKDVLILGGVMLSKFSRDRKQVLTWGMNVKEEILKSRYTIAKVANRELLFLYYKVGKTISEKVNADKWGSKTIQQLSVDLQRELNGLRGFSFSNLKNMRLFYEEWQACFSTDFSKITIGSTQSSQFENDKNAIGQLLTGQLQDSDNQQNKISQTVSGQFINSFVNIGFTSHIEIISKTASIDSRLFYIAKSAQEFWSVRTLKQHLKNKLFEKQGMLPNNFEQTIVSSKERKKALNNFRDHYLLDFIRISDEDEEDEKLLENEIVKNIKKFIISLGNDFAFIGNQFRIIVAEKEYFIDLLFFNRKLQSLVAFELKTGEFKPEYLGKMNFYLSTLDEYVKQEHENSSIGIILCKEKENKIVEFSFRDFNKAMGVATYKTSRRLPEKYKNILPDAEALKKLMY